MTENSAPIIETIAVLEREAADLELRALKLRDVARSLRDLARVPPVQLSLLTSTATATASPRTFSAPVQMVIQTKALPVQPSKPMPTTKLILGVVAEAGAGITFDELAEAVIPLIQSEATNKRKLLHSTLDYLKSKKKIFLFGDKYFLTDLDDG